MTHTVKRWTMPDCYVGETWPDHYSSGFGQSRDSDDLEASNFATVLTVRDDSRRLGFGTHMHALFNRARREGLRLERETW